jgi:hypothetical protein
MDPVTFELFAGATILTAGCAVGVAVGTEVGAVVGATVGTTVGTVVGATVGTAVGATVGTAVGATVGTAVGATVAMAVRMAVGAAVGKAVGIAVGLGVGLAPPALLVGIGVLGAFCELRALSAMATVAHPPLFIAPTSAGVVPAEAKVLSPAAAPKYAP